MRGDRYHIHHLLLTSGLGMKESVLILYGLSLVSGLASIFLSRATLLLGFLIVLAGLGLLFLCLYGLMVLQSTVQDREEEEKRSW